MTKLTGIKTKSQKFVCAVDQAELTLRLLEIGIKMKRKVGTQPGQMLASMRETAPVGSTEAAAIADFEQMAIAAIEYFGECIDELQSVN